MPRPCSVCSNKDLTAINSELRSGTSLRNATKKFGLTTSALFRHKAEHLGTPKEAQGEAALSRGSTRARVKKESTTRVSERAMVVSKRVPKREKAPPRAETEAEVVVERDPEEGEFEDVEWAGVGRGSAAGAPRETRVRIVMGLKAAARWEPGTGPRLAAAWKISVSSMERIAAEATRRVRAYNDRDYVRTRLLVALDEGLDAARGDNLKSLPAIAKAIAEVADIIGPKRHEISGPGGVPLGTPAGLSRLYERALAGDIEAERMLEQFAEHGSRAFVPEVVEAVDVEVVASVKVEPSIATPEAAPDAPAVAEGEAPPDDDDDGSAPPEAAPAA